MSQNTKDLLDRKFLLSYNISVSHELIPSLYKRYTQKILTEEKVLRVVDDTVFSGVVFQSVKEHIKIIRSNRTRFNPLDGTLEVGDGVSDNFRRTAENLFQVCYDVIEYTLTQIEVPREERIEIWKAITRQLSNY